MNFQQNRKQRYLKQMVSNARAIISNQIGLPLGVLKMNNYISLINYIEPLENIDLKIFSIYYDSLGSHPIGTERLEWNIEKLIEFEEEIDQINKRLRADVFRKCRELIDTFGSKITIQEKSQD